MPQIVAQYNPNAPGPQQSFSTNMPNGRGRMIIWNASNVQQTIQNGAYTDFCPAWTGMLYYLDQGELIVRWAVHSTLISNGNPISLVTVVTYNDSEKLPTNFPVPLQYQTNIGNAGAVSSSTSNLINDGNIAGTQIIESTPTGAASSVISILNDGTIAIYGDVGGVLTPLVQTNPGAASFASSVLLGDANRRVEILGNLKVDGPSLNVVSIPFTTQTGSISGTVSYYMDMRGTVGRLIIVFSNFQQGTALLPQVVIPSPFETGAQYLAGNCPSIQFFNGGAALLFQEVNGFQSSHNVSATHTWSWGEIPSGIKSLQITSNTGFASNGIMTIAGI